MFCLLYTVPDPEGYYLALYFPLGGVALVGWVAILRWAVASRWKKAEWLLPVVCVLLVLPQTLQTDRSQDHSLSDLTHLLWQDAPKGTLLITQDLSLMFSTVSMQLDEKIPQEHRVVAEYLLPLPW